jgi:hypothetical protein
MSDEIKNEIDDINEANNQKDEQSEEIIAKLSMNDDEEEENELQLSTPNGRDTPSAASFSDVIIEKQDELPSSVSEETHTLGLLQIISDKSNKEASSTILNSVIKKFI